MYTRYPISNAAVKNEELNDIGKIVSNKGCNFSNII